MNGDKNNLAYKIRLFDNPILERLARVHPITPICFWGPFIVILLFYAGKNFEYSIWEGIGVFVLSGLIWSLFEYGLHRYIFHLRPFNKFSQRLIFLLHENHHQDPDDRGRLMFPILPGAILMSLIAPLFFVGFGEKLGATLLAGFTFWYLVYDYSHYAIHHFRPWGSWGRMIRKNHLIHHVHSEINFGVSSPLWDHILRSKKD